MYLARAWQDPGAAITMASHPGRPVIIPVQVWRWAFGLVTRLPGSHRHRLCDVRVPIRALPLSAASSECRAKPGRFRAPVTGCRPFGE